MNTKLFVRNLSWSVTENDLYDLFGEVGEVVSVKIPTRREDGKPRGFAFVEMASAEASQAAIKRLNGSMFFDRDLVVDFQDESRASGGGNGGGFRSGGGGASAAASPNAKLFVRNIDYNVSEYDLKDLFQQAGTVMSVKIPTDKFTGQPKGFGFVEMGSTDEARQAIETLNQTYLQGKNIIIDYQDPNRNKGGSGGGGGRPPRRESYGGGGGRW